MRAGSAKWRQMKDAAHLPMLHATRDWKAA